MQTLKISELIAIFKEIKEKYGDLEVVYNELNDMDEDSYLGVQEVGITKGVIGDFNLDKLVVLNNFTSNNYLEDDDFIEKVLLSTYKEK